MTDDAFTLPFKVDTLGPNEKRLKFIANDAERQVLKERFELEDLTLLEGEACLKRLQRQMIGIDYRVTCHLRQLCVVTFKPIDHELNLAFRRVYAPESRFEKPKKELDIEIDETEDLDPIIEGVIDIFAAIGEELALEIDPFPRLEGQDYVVYGVGPEIEQEEVEKSNPFAVLADLKKK